MILDRLMEFQLDGESSQNKPRLEDSSLLTPARNATMAMMKVSHAGSIEPSIRELVKIRASQINGCAHCLSMHHRDALKEGERPDRLATIDAWWECDWFTPRERAALAWTEAVTEVSKHEVSDKLYETCRTVFSEQEMVDLTVGILEINTWNHLSIAFASPPDGWDLDTVR